MIAFNSTTKRPFFASLAVQMILPEAACAAVAGCGAAGAGGESGAVPSTDVRPAGGAAGRFSIVGGAMLGVSVDAGRGALFGA